MLARAMARLEEGLIALLLGVMTILTFTQVVMRYVFNDGLSWALEATMYMFGWLIFIGISYGVRIGSHIGVDALVRLMPPAGQRYAGLLAIALSLLYAALVLYGGYVYVDTMHTLGVEAEDLPIQRWLLVLIVPVGMALMIFRLLQAGWAILTGREGGLKLANEARETIEQFKDDGEHAR
ncbi:MAG: TRAP transporter small permease [Reyranellaceae bacterium]